MKLIAIDIGNTSIHLARLDKGHWSHKKRVATSRHRTDTLKALKSMLPADKKAVVVIASVVPQAGKFLKGAIQKLGVKTFLIGSDIRVPMKNLYTNPKQVGVDRLLNGLAAYHQIKKALIVVDFGTAITFDVVSRKGEYLGGVIAPGIEISLEALFNKTALLPKIRLQHPANFIGKNTVESIRVGCSVGIGGLCDRVIEAIEKRHGFKARVVATGGYASFMKRYSQRAQSIREDLIFDGILLTYKRHSEQA